MKKIKEKFKKVKAHLTKQNIIKYAVGAFAIATVLHLGGYNYLQNIFSSRAGGANLESGEQEKDISNFKEPGACQRLNNWGPPLVKDDEVNKRSLYLCRSAYSVQYDPKTGVPLWSTQILNRLNLASFNIPSSIIPSLDPDLPKKMQPTLKTYQDSGYQFGFLSPIEDMYINELGMDVNLLEELNQKSLRESYYITNSVPEAKKTAIIRKAIEQNARSLLKDYDPLYVISGPVYLNGKTNGFIGEGDNKIAIPTHIYKVITNPNTYGSMAYLIPNTNDMSCGNNCSPSDFLVTINEVERVSGIEFFSSLGSIYAMKVRQDLNELNRKKL